MLNNDIILELLSRVDSMVNNRTEKRRIYLYGDTCACLKGLSDVCVSINADSAPNELDYELLIELDNIDVYVQSDEALLAFVCNNVEYDENSINIINYIMDKYNLTVAEVDSIVLQYFPKMACSNYKDLLDITEVREVS